MKGLAWHVIAARYAVTRDPGLGYITHVSPKQRSPSQSNATPIIFATLPALASGSPSSRFLVITTMVSEAHQTGGYR